MYRLHALRQRNLYNRDTTIDRQIDRQIDRKHKPKLGLPESNNDPLRKEETILKLIY